MVCQRPLYETQSDVLRETDFSLIISKKFNCTLSKLPMRYGLDFTAMRDGRAVSFIETKVRTNAVSAYSTYMLSVGKFTHADALTRSTGLPCFLCVMWSDAWGYTPLRANPGFEVAFGGRSDRGDAQDMEPVFLIPMSSFVIRDLHP